MKIHNIGSWLEIKQYLPRGYSRQPLTSFFRDFDSHYIHLNDEFLISDNFFLHQIDRNPKILSISILEDSKQSCEHFFISYKLRNLDGVSEIKFSNGLPVRFKYKSGDVKNLSLADVYEEHMSEHDGPHSLALENKTKILIFSMSSFYSIYPKITLSELCKIENLEDRKIFISEWISGASDISKVIMKASSYAQDARSELIKTHNNLKGKR